MAWRQKGNKPLSEPMMAYFTDARMPHSSSMSKACLVDSPDFDTLPTCLSKILKNEIQYFDMMTSSDGNIFRVTGP